MIDRTVCLAIDKQKKLAMFIREYDDHTKTTRWVPFGPMMLKGNAFPLPITEFYETMTENTVCLKAIQSGQAFIEGREWREIVPTFGEPIKKKKR